MVFVIGLCGLRSANAFAWLTTSPPHPPTTTHPNPPKNQKVCAIVTEGFLNYSRARGNDLITPRPEFRFPGLKPGDRWCLCASRWQVRVRVDQWMWVDWRFVFGCDGGW